jgi:formylmethanofuran dehydrogenase subunit E
MALPDNAWDQCVKFHGHACPGLAIGFRVSEAAIEKLNLTFSADEEIVCITENDACGVDAVQTLIGCSMGKGNLIYWGTGKQAFSFFNRNTGEKVRLRFKKPLDRDKMDRDAMQMLILTAPLDELFEYKEPSYTPPQKARLFTSIACEQCGESAPEHKMRLQEGKKVCLDCFSDYNRGW